MNKAYVFLLFLTWTQAQAVPNGSDLLQACEVSLENGFRDIEGQMCEYYVITCDCDLGSGNAGSGICIPDHVSTETLARDVVNGIKNSPGLLQEYAVTAVEKVLSEKYPCR